MVQMFFYEKIVLEKNSIIFSDEVSLNSEIILNSFNLKIKIELK